MNSWWPRWPGGQSHLSRRKIYISEARLQALRVRRQRPDQLCIPLRYLVATVATLTAISASRWPGGRVASHIYLVGKSTSQKTNFACARRPKTGSVSHSISLSYVVATAATLATDSSVVLLATDCSVVLNGRSHAPIVQQPTSPKKASAEDS